MTATKKKRKKRTWRQVVRFVAWTITAVLLCATGVVYWLYLQTQEVPDFYLTATTTPPKSLARANKSLDQQVKQLASRAKRYGTWSAEFTEDEINAWLANRLPAEFPGLLPRGISNPRVALEDNRVLLAARFKDKRLETVVSCELQITIGDSRNSLWLDVERLKAGELPLPRSRISKYLERPLENGELSIEFDSQQSGEFRAKLVVPDEYSGSPYKPVVIESVEIEVGKLIISGRTGPGDE